MLAYLARQAIFDRTKSVIGYELLFRNGPNNAFPGIDPDEATSKLLNNAHLNTGLHEVTGGKTAFINFYRDTILSRFPTSLNPQTTVIELLETIEVDEAFLEACKQLRHLGYVLAIDDYDFDPKWEKLFSMVDIVKFDINADLDGKLTEFLPELHRNHIRVVAERVETQEQFQYYYDLGVDYFQGYFFTQPEMLKTRSIPDSKLNLMMLLNACASIDFDFDEVNEIIERDVGLAFKLLRFINNPASFGRQKINSLRHALTYMGQVEVKKFIALLVLANLNDEKPHELLQLSLVRARFCSLISESRGDNSNPPKGFLVGLFSFLDALLDREMDSIMHVLPVDDDLKKALCGKDNVWHDYLLLSQSLEYSDWTTFGELCSKLDLSGDDTCDYYQGALQWAADVMHSAD